MVAGRSTAMDDAAVRSFLGRGGTGVLSVADGDEPYSVPVSYGFDPDAEALYFRLGVAEGSEKERFLGSPTPARFVVYRRTDAGWRSVIAAGELERVDDDVTVEIATALRGADLPLVEIWDRPFEDVEFELYRLAVDRLTGRSAADGAAG